MYQEMVRQILTWRKCVWKQSKRIWVKSKTKQGSKFVLKVQRKMKMVKLSVPLRSPAKKCDCFQHKLETQNPSVQWETPASP
jgi:hypothetical protein